MAYILVLKKTEGDKIPFVTTKAVEIYLSSFGRNDLILGSPGYMSNTANTIQQFCQDFKSLNQNGKNEIVFSYGMNGKTQLKSGRTIFDEHYQHFQPKQTPLSTKKDHSKFLIFLEKQGYTFTKNELETNDIINNYRVKAVLIGSSNLSYRTYFTGQNKKADKGETDVFFLDENLFNGHDEEALNFLGDIKESCNITEQNLSVVLSKSLGNPINLNDFSTILLKK